MFQSRLVVRFSAMQFFTNHICSRTLSFTKDVVMYCLRSPFAWLAFDMMVETKSLMAFREVPDRLGLGMTIILAWRQMKQRFFLSIAFDSHQKLVH